MDVFVVLIFCLVWLLITFMWMQIANRAAMALDRFSRTRDAEIGEPFLRKTIGITDDDFSVFLKQWDRERGFEPGELMNAFLSWKLAAHYRELRPPSPYELPGGPLDVAEKDLTGFSVEELQKIIENPAEHTMEIVEDAHRLLEERLSEDGAH